MKQVRKNKIIFLIFTSLLFFISCEKGSEVNNKKLAHLYVDITIAKEKYQNYPDSIDIKKDELFKKYKISKDEYKKVMLGMNDNAEEWDKFFKEAKVYLDSLKTLSRKETK